MRKWSLVQTLPIIILLHCLFSTTVAGTYGGGGGGGGNSGGENFAGKISPLRKMAKFPPPRKIFAARDSVFFLVRVTGEYCPLRHVVWCTRQCCNQQRPEQAQYCCLLAVLAVHIPSANEHVSQRKGQSVR